MQKKVSFNTYKYNFLPIIFKRYSYIIKNKYKTLSCIQKLNEIIFNLCNLKHHCLIWQFTYILIHNRKLHDICVEIQTLRSPIFTYIIASYESKVCFLFVHYVEFLLIYCLIYAYARNLEVQERKCPFKMELDFKKQQLGFCQITTCVTKKNNSTFPISI